MTTPGDRRRTAEDHLRRHDSFSRKNDRIVAERSPFDATVTVQATVDRLEYTVFVEVPTLDAVVLDEEVPAALRDGWFDTFQRRLEDPAGAVRGEVSPPEIDRGEELVEITVRIRTADPDTGVEDVAAVLSFVEGTYLQGVVPGYDYADPVASMRANASDNYEEGAGPPPL